MQAVGATVENRSVGFAFPNRLAALLEYSIVRLFGCWHLEMGSPITLGGETYRACLDCGARRRFDADDWNMCGPYYF